MARLARSKSCLGTGGRREQSSSPENNRRTGEKRGRRRSYDWKQDGDESSSSNKIYCRAKGRNRSKSPRRNSWREEIKKIKSWREDKEIKRTGLEMKISRHRSKEYGEFKNLSDESCKKLKKLAKKDCVPRETSPCKKRKNRINEPRRLSNKKERLSLIARRDGSSSSKNIGGSSTSDTSRKEFKGTQNKLGKKPDRSSKEDISRRKVNRSCMKVLPSSLIEERTVEIRRASCDSGSEELELSISDQDVFPELRDDSSKNAEARTGFDTDASSTEKREKFESFEIKISNNEDEVSSRRSVRLKAGEDAATKDQTNPESASMKPLSPEVAESNQGFVVPGSVLGNESSSSASCVSTSATSLVSGKDNSAMERSFSLLELKMEVYTTRLKELEWEREQLRKERKDLQGEEQCARRELLSRLQERERLSGKISQLENEDKENRG